MTTDCLDVQVIWSAVDVVVTILPATGSVQYRTQISASTQEQSQSRDDVKNIKKHIMRSHLTDGLEIDCTYHKSLRLQVRPMHDST